MIQGDIEDEHLAACHTLWTLAFDKEVVIKIKVVACPSYMYVTWNLNKLESVYNNDRLIL